MDLEDLEPGRNQAGRRKPKDLDAMGVDQLALYLAELEAEAIRVREKIAAKKAYRKGVEDLFGG